MSTDVREAQIAAEIAVALDQADRKALREFGLVGTSFEKLPQPLRAIATALKPCLESEGVDLDDAAIVRAAQAVADRLAPMREPQQRIAAALERIADIFEGGQAKQKAAPACSSPPDPDPPLREGQPAKKKADPWRNGPVRT